MSLELPFSVHPNKNFRWPTDHVEQTHNERCTPNRKRRSTFLIWYFYPSNITYLLENLLYWILICFCKIFSWIWNKISQKIAQHLSIFNLEGKTMCSIDTFILQRLAQLLTKFAWCNYFIQKAKVIATQLFSLL